MNSNTPPTIRERILAKIEHNELQMHSRTFFILKLASAIILALAVLALSVFIGNLVFFTLRINGHNSLLALGGSGLLLFARVFPWWLLALDILLTSALVWLVRHFQFGYRKPVLYMFLALVFIAVVAGFALDHETRFNDHLLQDADDGLLPAPLQGVYQGTRHAPPPGSAFRGVITNIAQDAITIFDADLAKSLTVILPTHEHDMPLTVGQTVFIVGNESNGTIQALDVHPLDPNGVPPDFRHPDHRQ